MPAKQEPGNWKPHHVPALERSIAAVFRSGDIGRLNSQTYQFIILNMGFIAHFDLNGFRHCYADLDLFRTMLQTTEHSRDPDYNLRWADKYELDNDFIRWYGIAYCKSVADGIRRIVSVARGEPRQHALAFAPLELR